MQIDMRLTHAESHVDTSTLCMCQLRKLTHARDTCQLTHVAMCVDTSENKRVHMSSERC